MAKEQKKINGIVVEKKVKKKKIIKKSIGGHVWYWVKKVSFVVPIIVLILVLFPYERFTEKEEVININKPYIIRTHKFSVSEEEIIISSFIRYKTFDRTPEIVADYIAYWLLKLCPEFGIDHSFTLAKIYVESAYEPSRRNSKTGARGLMQVLTKGIGYNKKTETYKEKFDLNKIYNIPYNIECGLKIFKEKMNMVQVEQDKSGHRYAKNINMLARALEKYVGASTPEGRKTARKYIDDIYKVQGEYIVWRHEYLKDKTMEVELY